MKNKAILGRYSVAVVVLVLWREMVGRALMEVKTTIEADKNLNEFGMLKGEITSFSGRILSTFSSDLFLIRFTFWNLF